MMIWVWVDWGNHLSWLLEISDITTKDGDRLNMALYLNWKLRCPDNNKLVSRQLSLASLICLKSCDPILISDLGVCSVCSILCALQPPEEQTNTNFAYFPLWKFNKNIQTAPWQLTNTWSHNRNIFSVIKFNYFLQCCLWFVIPFLNRKWNYPWCMTGATYCVGEFGQLQTFSYDSI